jgi:hypothetical protein
MEERLRVLEGLLARAYMRAVREFPLPLLLAASARLRRQYEGSMRSLRLHLEEARRRGWDQEE